MLNSPPASTAVRQEDMAPHKAYNRDNRVDMVKHRSNTVPRTPSPSNLALVLMILPSTALSAVMDSSHKVSIRRRLRSITGSNKVDTSLKGRMKVMEGSRVLVEGMNLVRRRLTQPGGEIGRG